MLSKIRALIFDNFVIKIFSLVFAAVLWFHVVSKGRSEEDFIVPLELRDIPRGMVVAGDPPGYINVRLLGQDWILKGLSPRDIGAALSLRGSKEGERVYYLAPSNITIPGDITVAGVKPSEFKLRLETVAGKIIPVKPVISGRPAKGFRLDRVDVVPENVAVKGPKSLLTRLDSVETTAVDITGASGSMDTIAPLDIPRMKGVVFGSDSVEVRVVLTPARRVR